MAVTFDALGAHGSGGAGGAGPPASPLTWSHTCSGSDRLLLVEAVFGWGNNSGLTVSATYNGVAMTELAQVASNNGTSGQARLFALLAPDTGSNTVSLTFSGGSTDANSAIEAGSVSYNGVEQSSLAAAVTNVATAFGNSANPSMVVSSATGNMVMSMLMMGGSITSAGDTQRWLKNVNSNTGGGNGAGSDAAGAASVTMDWTASSEFWGMIAANIQAVAAVGSAEWDPYWAFPFNPNTPQGQMLLASRWIDSSNAGSTAIFPIDLAGSLTPAGSLINQVNKLTAGSATPSGTMLKQVFKNLSGSLTPSGTNLKQLARTFAGAITPSGSLVKQVNKLLAGIFAPAAVRSFNGSADFLTFDPGTLASVDGSNITLAFLWKPNSLHSGCLLFGEHGAGVHDSTFSVNEFNNGQIWYSANTAVGVVPWTGSDGWMLAVITNEQGGAGLRSHKYLLDSPGWAHTLVNGAGVAAATDTPATSFWVGKGFGSFLDGAVAAIAVWADAWTDGQVEDLTDDFSVAGWKALTPDAMWVFNQSSTSESVLDRSGNGADQTAITGTTVQTSDLPKDFDFGGISGRLTVIKQVVRSFAGSITPSGSLVKRVDKLLAGSVASSGTNTKQVNKNLGGALSPSGTLATVRLIVRSFAGTVTIAGTLTKTKLTLLAGSLTPQGSLSKSSWKLLTGAISPSATLANVRVVLRSFAGSMTPSGLLSKLVLLRPSGSSSPTGTLLKQVSKKLAGTSSPSGALTRAVTRIKAFAGTVASAGSLTKTKLANMAGAVTSTGTISKRVNKSFTASTGPSGNLSALRTVLRSFSGTVTINGQLQIAQLSGAVLRVGILFMALRTRAEMTLRRGVEWVTDRAQGLVSQATDAIHIGPTYRVVKIAIGQGGTLQEGQDITMPASTVEYVWVTFKAEADPTGGTVEFAVTEAMPTGGQFQAGQWVTAESQPSIDQYVARFLAGSVNFPLVAGKHYLVHAKITAGSETPVIYAGRIHTT